MGLLWIILCGALSASASVLFVPEDYPTVADAFRASEDGDTILLSPGIYRELIVFPSGTHTLAGRYLLNGDTNLIRETLLYPDTVNHPDSMGIVILNGNDIMATLSGLALRDGRGSMVPPITDPCRTLGGAILARRARAKINACHFEFNHSCFGSAVACDSGAIVQMNDCDVGHNNSSQATIWSRDADVSLFRTRVHHNYDTTGGPLGLGYGNEVLIDSCLFDSNQTPTAWFGSLCLGVAMVTVRNSCFMDNVIETTSHVGAGLNIQGSAVIENCEFRRNVAAAGSGLAINEGNHIVSRCVFADNFAPLGDAGVSAQSGRHTFDLCRFTNNVSGQGSSALTSSGSSCYLNLCTFLGNTTISSDLGAAVRSFGPSDTLVALHCHFAGNHPSAVNDSFDNPLRLDLRNCYWGDSTGPYNALLNPSGRGDTLFTTHAQFIPWLRQPPDLDAAEPMQPLPRHKELFAAYPNPFNGMVSFQIAPRPQIRDVDIYNLLGQHVTRLQIPAFSEHVLWTPQGLSSGLYFAQMGGLTIKLAYLR